MSSAAPKLNQLSRKILSELAESLLASGAQSALKEEDLQGPRIAVAMRAARRVIENRQQRINQTRTIAIATSAVAVGVLVISPFLRVDSSALIFFLAFAAMLFAAAAFAWISRRDMIEWEPFVAERLNDSGLIERFAHSPESLLSIHDHVPPLFGAIFLGSRSESSTHVLKLLRHNLDWYLSPPRRLIRAVWLCEASLFLLVPLLLATGGTMTGNATQPNWLFWISSAVAGFGFCHAEMKKKAVEPYLMLYFGERLYGPLEEETTQTTSPELREAKL